MDTQLPDIFQETRHLGEGGERFWRRALAVGLIALAASVALGFAAGDHGRSFFFAYAVSFAYVLSLALGALFFVVLQHLTRAGWSVVVRRVAEGVAATLPVLALLFVPILVGLHQLYHWSHAEAVAADHLLHGKSPYLNVSFFVVRWVLYAVIWGLTVRAFVGRSLAQDASGAPELSLEMQKRAAPAMLLFGITVTFASIDLLMSLDAHWFSTIFGVYFFAGSVVGFFALLAVLLLVLQRAGYLRHAVTTEHYHDIGKLLFAFIVFWAYIGFSQYMLYWYANIPEETGWFLRRQTNGWGWVSLLLLFGHFVLPFVALLSRAPKRNRRMLGAVAAWMLVVHWVDLYWIAFPELRPQDPLPHLVDLTTAVGLVGVWLASAAFIMRRRSLVAERDPRLAESLGFENA